MAEVHVNGRDYQLVSLNEMTLDEAMVVYDYTKLSFDQIPDLEGFHPGLIAALLHVSVARAEPGQSSRTIRQTIGRIPVASLEQVFMDISEEVDEADPPLPPAVSTNGGSGDASSTSGESPPALSPAAPTGSRGSATGATSGPRISAV